MKKLKMLETVGGALKDDVVVFMDDKEADELLKENKAELYKEPEKKE